MRQRCRSYAVAIFVTAMVSALLGESKALEVAASEATLATQEQSNGDQSLTEELARAERRIDDLKNTLAEKQRSIDSLKARLKQIETARLETTRQSPTTAHTIPQTSSVARRTFFAVLGTLLLLALLMTVYVTHRRLTASAKTTLSTSPRVNGEPQRQVFGKRVPFSIALALLYIPTGLVRGMMISLLPLQALELLGSAQKVSVMYLLVGIGGIGIVLTIPRLCRRVGSRRVFDLGVICTIVSMAVLPFVSSVTFFIGMLLHFLAVASFEIATMLFLMTALKRDEYKFFEPYRVICAASGFVVGPVASIYLRDNVGQSVPYALTAMFAIAGWFYVRYLKVGDIGPSPVTLSSNPLTYIHRFFSQRRLAIAYTISIGRYAWWVMFFIYVPIYAASTELGALVGGLLVSVGTAATWLAPLWGRLGRRIGLRRLFIISSFGTGVLTLVAAISAGAPTLCALVLLLAAIVATMSDGASHLPFYRATRGRERTEMSGVYATHRDLGQLLPPTIFAFILKFLPLPVVFFTGGFMMLILTPLCRYLPRRM